MPVSSLMERYSRNRNTLTREEQKRLSLSTAAVLGLGGLGGGVAEMLARIGVGKLLLMDGDAFDVSNLNRQVFSTEENLGTPKARAAVERIRVVNSSIHVTGIQEFLEPEQGWEKIRDADLVVDCLDTIKARFLLQSLAAEHNIPMVSGAIAGTAGQVMTIFPGDPGLNFVYGGQGEHPDHGVELERGNLSFCALFIASLQASEAVKVLLGKKDLLRNKLFIADLMINSFEIVSFV